jgi:tetratricopeptide (TPR) repeat protein
LRAGYYSKHFTFGIGIGFYSFTLDYVANFGEIGLMNGFGLAYRWRFKKSGELSKESLVALSREKMNLKAAEKRFKEAKRLYNKKEYLEAIDMLSSIVIAYPNYESPRHFYEQIAKMMKETACSDIELDFGKLTYAKAYIVYYGANYKEALNEWKKNIDFTGAIEEVKKYSRKIDTVLKLEKLGKREKDLINFG